MFDSRSRLLVTGATGFLGGAIIAELAAQSIWPQVRMLVRANSKEEGAARIRTVLTQFEVPETEIARVSPDQVILGDLGAPLEMFADPALKSVTHVINSAALATFSTNPQLWPINVEGTFTFARRLVETAHLERFVHVGTAMCVGPDAPPPVAEDYSPPQPIRHLVPYTETKIEIENRFRRELPQLPLVQARPTIIVGHSRLGTRPSGSIFWVFRTAMLLERWTVAPQGRIDVVPVDWAARALIELTIKPALKHRLYHLSAGPVHASTFDELDAAIARGRGVAPILPRYRQATLDELAAMSGEYNARLGPCHPRIMQRAIRLYGTFAALNMTFRNEHLIDEGIEPPPPFAAYADLCAATSEGLTIADQMMADFK
jgi:nucleoside-diphosphate-sugar epimerase